LTVVGGFTCLAATTAPAAVTTGDNWKWPAGEIPVCWTNLVAGNHEDYDDQETKRGWVKEAVNINFATFTPLSFTGWEACNADGEDGIRIKILWDGTTASSSHVGKSSMGSGQADGEAGMNLQFAQATIDPKAVIISAALHEFGHALGFRHEHRRADAKPGLGCADRHPAKDGDPELVGDQQYLTTAYDANSIMNYCPLFGSFFTSLSEADVIGLQNAYGAGDGGTLFSKAVHTGNITCPSKYGAKDGLGKAFLHIFNNSCYSCPSGYGRTINPDVVAPTACAKGLEFKKASYRGKPGCGSGSFQNGLTNDCYKCPEGYDRTAIPANRLDQFAEACVRRDWGWFKEITIDLRPH
jgi:hypothetical protein